MKFNVFCEYLEKIEQTSKRLEMFEILSQMFQKTEKNEVKPIVYFTQEQLLPPFYNVEMGMAESMMRKAIVSASGEKEDEIKAMYKKEGGDASTFTNFLQRGIRVARIRKPWLHIGGAGEPFRLMSSRFRG